MRLNSSKFYASMYALTFDVSFNVMHIYRVIVTGPSGCFCLGLRAENMMHHS